MKKPLFSVIIPAYNEEKYIKPCISSIVNLNYPKSSFEVIVVNNNSTDNTENIVKRNFPKIKVVKEEEQGVVFARIRGIKEAKGKIIAFTDADTIVPKDWLKKIAAAYKSNPKIVAVGGPSNFRPKNLITKIGQYLTNSTSVYFNYALGHNLSCQKNAYLIVGGFSPKINLCEDFYIAKKLKEVGKFEFLSDNPVFPSDRRFNTDLSKLLIHTLKLFINTYSILAFEKTFFFKFSEAQENKNTILNRKIAFNFLTKVSCIIASILIAFALLSGLKTNKPSDTQKGQINSYLSQKLSYLKENSKLLNEQIKEVIPKLILKKKLPWSSNPFESKDLS